MNNYPKKNPIPDSTNKISGQIVDAAFVVHSTYGPGLLESVYEKCLIHELKLRDIKTQSQMAVPLDFKGLLGRKRTCTRLVSRRLRHSRGKISQFPTPRTSTTTTHIPQNNWEKSRSTNKF